MPAARRQALLVVLPLLTSCTHGFITVPALAVARVRAKALASSSDAASGDPSDLLRQAAALRAEASAMESQVSKTRAPLKPVETPAPYPASLVESVWRIVMTIRGKKGEANTVPIRLTFSCQFSSDDNILLVSAGTPAITRGYIWAPDRDANDDRTYIAFDIGVKGLSAVPDGKLYLNARVDQDDATGGYKLSDGVLTIKEVDNRRGFGLFSFAGILAEFKVVGEFVATPLREMPP